MNSGFLWVWGVYLKGHINASLQNCLTSTTKPVPMAPKWSLKHDWFGQWGTGAWLCPQRHHQPSAWPKYQPENAGFGANSIFTYSTKIRTGISVGYSTRKDGSNAIRTFSSHPQLSIHLLGFQSFCHQAAPPRGMTYICTWNLNVSMPWNIKIRFFFSPAVSVGINSASPSSPAPRTLHVRSPKAGRHIWDFEKERKDQQKMNVYPTCTSWSKPFQTINPFLCPFLLQELPEPSPRVNSGRNVQALQQPGGKKCITCWINT